MAQATKPSAEELSQSERMAVRAIAQTLDSASSYAADAMGMVTKEGVGRMLQGLRYYIRTADTLALRILEKNGVNPNVIVESPETVKSIASDATRSISHSFPRPESNVTVRKLLLPKDVQHRDDCNKLLHGTECSCDYDERLEDSRLQMALAKDGVDVADQEEDDDGNMTVPYPDRKMREIYGDIKPKDKPVIEMGYDPKTMTFTAEITGRVTKHPGDDE